MPKKLAISFSGGRTSAVMTHRLWNRRTEWDEAIIAFANTGCEHPATLDFVHECETRFGWPVVWIEAVVQPGDGDGIRHRVVSFETASRNGEPFEEAVKKYGIFNHTAKACTSKLKELPMRSYLMEQGFSFGKAKDHDTAIGIRSDEMDRVSSKRIEQRLIYPLVDAGITKRDVAIEIKRWGFDLGIPGDHYGNCTWCWKKSLRKHLTLASESPDVFDFPKRMEEKYGTHKADRAAAAPDGRRYWFRGHRSVEQLIQLSVTEKFKPYVDDPFDHAKDVVPFDPELDVGSSCGESCEIGADEN